MIDDFVEKKKENKKQAVSSVDDLTFVEFSREEINS